MVLLMVLNMCISNFVFDFFLQKSIKSDGVHCNNRGKEKLTRLLKEVMLGLMLAKTHNFKRLLIGTKSTVVIHMLTNDHPF